VTQENLAEYAIDVHGLKSASENIGAEAVRERAARMEMAAKTGDFAAVAAENPALVSDADKLVSEISAWLNKRRM
jgi:HPt (histidine-containing phosphotransfer) domain-containing protein